MYITTTLLTIFTLHKEGHQGTEYQVRLWLYMGITNSAYDRFKDYWTVSPCLEDAGETLEDEGQLFPLPLGAFFRNVLVTFSHC